MKKVQEKKADKGRAKTSERFSTKMERTQRTIYQRSFN